MARALDLPAGQSVKVADAEVCPADVHRALASGELTVWFQPKVRIDTGRVAGAEALLRWRHPALGLLGPADILSAAQDSGQITEITQFVLDIALAWCSRWRAVGADVPVAVNVTPADLAEPTFPEVVERLLDEYGLPGGVLTLEITETGMLEEPTRTAAVMHRLRQLGVALSADDFGVGYSSLARLVHLPLSELKVDLGLVLGMHASPQAAGAVRAAVDLGHAIGLRVVAEGVEDGRSLDRLREYGCDLAQGYLFAPALDPEDVVRWLAGRAPLQRTRPVPANRTPDPPRCSRQWSVRPVAQAAVRAFGWPALSATAAVVAVYLAWQIFRWGAPTHQKLIGDLVFVPVNGSAIVAAWFAGRAHRYEPGTRRGWRWLAAALAGYLLGDLIQMAYELGGPNRELPFPSWSDAAYLSFYPMALVGLLCFPAPRRSRDEKFTLMLDMALVVLGGATVIWYAQIGPIVATGGEMLAAATSLAYPVGDLVLLFGVTSLLLRGTVPGTRRALRLLVIGFVIYLITDLWYGQIMLHGTYKGGDCVDTGWVVAQILMGLAALAHARRPGRSPAVYLRTAPPARLRISLLPYIAVGAGYALLLVSARDQEFYPLGGLVLAAGGLTALVTVRQVTALRDNVRLLSLYHKLAATDGLTGLHNRRHFLELAEVAFGAAQRHDQPLALLMIDIDNFKEINDRYGHQTGDQVLRAVADVCSMLLRPEDLVGRYGGDELIAVLPDTSAADGAVVGERLQARLERLLVDSAVTPVPVTLSIGVADLADTRSLTALLARADVGLYAAKRAGRNCVKTYLEA